MSLTTRSAACFNTFCQCKILAVQLQLNGGMNVAVRLWDEQRDVFNCALELLKIWCEEKMTAATGEALYHCLNKKKYFKDIAAQFKDQLVTPAGEELTICLYLC